MTNSNPTPADVPVVEVKKPNFITRIRTNHPRKAKAALIGSAIVVAGVVGVALGAKKSDELTEIKERTEDKYDAVTDALSEA